MNSAAAAVLREAFPQVAISLSSEVAPEIREYERSVTTCANAFVQPLMDRYLGKLLTELDGPGLHRHPAPDAIRWRALRA